MIFSDSFISEKDAQALLDSQPHPTYSADFTEPTATEARDAGASAAADADSGSAHAYEVLNMSPHRYLCSIPVIQPPAPENETANELARAEEARELSRAATSGWELLGHLEGSCLYFSSGWWSYSFCNNHKIVQYHGLAAVPDGRPPRRDPNTVDYVLGRVPAIPASSEQKSLRSSKGEPIPAELQVKGDQRYMVQRLGGGTICDLTGRERTIEVQYHCVPGMRGDRIGWIKEVTICAYLMVINTPSLCNDVAFLPPEEVKANPISCQLIIDGDGTATPPLLDQNLPKDGDIVGTAHEEAYPEDHEPLPAAVMTAGGIVIGSRAVLSRGDQPGKPPLKIPPTRGDFPSKGTNQERLIELIARAASKEDGGKVEVLTAEQLEKLELEPKDVEEMREQMEKLAGDAGWKLEVIELPGEDLRELRGYIDGEDEEGEEEGEGGSEEGSQEKFKDEL